MASLERDFWELRSAEQSHRDHPKTFSIPALEARASLKRGDAAKLIFDIEAYDEDGALVIGGERMWVIVSECVGQAYIGILDAQPSLEQSEDTYLRLGAEIPFRPEHVIEIAQPPTEHVQWQLWSNIRKKMATQRKLVKRLIPVPRRLRASVRNYESCHETRRHEGAETLINLNYAW